MSKGVLLSPTHGVNPSLGVCPLCYGENGEIVLLGRLKGDAEAPRHVVTDHLCDECSKRRGEGYIALIVVESEAVLERTGEIVWVRPEAFHQLYTAADAETIAAKGAAFISRDMGEQLKSMAQGGEPR